MKVCIFGSRNLTDYWTCKKLIVRVLAQAHWEVTEEVCGGAQGADAIGADWALQRGIPVKFFHADWERHGKAAGPIRNKEMAEYCDCGIALWDGKSKGTKDMIDQLKAAGKPYAVVTFNVPNIAITNKEA